MDRSDLTVLGCFATMILAVLAAFANLVLSDHALMAAGIPYVN